MSDWPTGGFVDADEWMHPVDPVDRSWNESWFFSWIDLDGGPAGFFRVGVLPNQERAMLWSFVHVDGEWLGREESRLAFGDLDLGAGVAYDKWALRFAWEPHPPLGGARFSYEGTLLARTGSRAGRHVPVSIDLVCRATSGCIGTGTGGDARQSPYVANRFEQSLEATGTVLAEGTARQVRTGAHRDRSWGPREWRQLFTLGDIQSGGRQLYFVGRTFPGLGGGFIRDGNGLQHLRITDGSIDFDDDSRTFRSASMRLEGRDGVGVDASFVPVSPSVTFDMAHTCDEPEHWLYYRTLVEATVAGWDAPCRGWFESSRYGVA